MKSLNNVLGIIVAVMCFMSCAGTPRNEKNLFTGLVVDETGNPVPDFELDVKTSGGRDFLVRTNDSGIFILRKVKKGNYSFSGEKDGYTGINEKREVRDFSSINCFRVCSGDEVFLQVIECVKDEDYKNAIALLDSLHAERKTELRECINFYKKSILRRKK